MAKIKISKEILKDLLDKDYHCSRIADKLGYSLPTIRRICAEHGLADHLYENGKIAQRLHNRTVRWIHGSRSRLKPSTEITRNRKNVDQVPIK